MDVHKTQFTTDIVGLRLGFQSNHLNQVLQQLDQEQTALRMCVVLLNAECWDTGL